MAAIPVGSLVDNFDSLSAYWDSPYGGATALGGYGYVPCTHTGGTPNYAGLLSTRPSVGNTWTMSSTELFVEVVTRPVASGATVCYCQLAILSPTSGTYLSILYDAVGGSVSFGSYAGFSDAGLVVIPHIPALHRWWRIRHGAGKLYWETAPDGITWTVRRTLTGPPPWVITDAASVQLDSSRNGGTNDYAQFDNVNISSYSTTVTPSTVSSTSTVPTLGLSTGDTISPATVPATSTTPAPGIGIGIQPQAVPATTAIPAASLLFDSTMSPAKVDMVAAVPLPVVRASTTTSPNRVDTAVNVPVPSIVVGATTLVAPSGIVFVRYPAAQFVQIPLLMPVCGGSATTVSLSGSAVALTLSGTAVIV